MVWPYDGKIQHFLQHIFYEKLVEHENYIINELVFLSGRIMIVINSGELNSTLMGNWGFYFFYDFETRYVH